LGALASAVVKLVGFWVAALQGPDDAAGPARGLAWGQLCPRWVAGGEGGDSFGQQVGGRQLALLQSFFAQGLLKNILTQADKYILGGSFSLAEQGHYAKVENLASLAPRMFFFPIEESMRGLVSKLLPQGRLAAVEAAPKAASRAGGSCNTPTTTTTAASATTGVATKKKQRATSKGRQRSSSSRAAAPSHALLPVKDLQQQEHGAKLALAVSVLSSVAHLVLLLGMCIAGLGYAFAPIVVAFLRWDAPAVPLLALYCTYVFTLALNGVTEAFATAASDPARLRVANFHFLAIAAIGSSLMLLLLQKHGLIALIAVNALSTVRAIVADEPTATATILQQIVGLLSAVAGIAGESTLENQVAAGRSEIVEPKAVNAPAVPATPYMNVKEDAEVAADFMSRPHFMEV